MEVSTNFPVATSRRAHSTRRSHFVLRQLCGIAAFASRVTLSTYHVLCVFCRRAREQVARVYARRIIARVSYHLAEWKDSRRQVIRHLMGSPSLPIEPNTSIPFDSACPDPAFVIAFFLHEGPKALFDRCVTGAIGAKYATKAVGLLASGKRLKLGMAKLAIKSKIGRSHDLFTSSVVRPAHVLVDLGGPTNLGIVTWIGQRYLAKYGGSLR